MIRRVLLVDDDQALTTILATALADEGFAVTTARNGLEACGRSRRRTPAPWTS